MNQIQRAFAILIVGVVSLSAARAQEDSETNAPVQRHAPHLSSKTRKPFLEQMQPAGICDRDGEVYSNGYVDKWCAKYGPSGCVEVHCIRCNNGTWRPDQICG
ncbi:hypothetical protein [Caballeronia mineralivorans]|uniref:hypothetical protein n=1 Tax=Caballeronia mineralivorans TaxID=2010198 RepID=UPI0023F512DD|nr:hypothetical protein [Caballeronia mineralivorans]